jgi:hypothetical protein
MPGAIFLIARLFSDHDDLAAGRPLAEDGLRGLFVEIAPGAACGSVPQVPKS